MQEQDQDVSHLAYSCAFQTETEKSKKAVASSAYKLDETE